MKALFISLVLTGTAFAMPGPAQRGAALFAKDAAIQKQIAFWRSKGYALQGLPRLMLVKRSCPKAFAGMIEDDCFHTWIATRYLRLRNADGDELVSVNATVFLPSRMSRRAAEVRPIPVD